ncbi:unnamed protein product, partial [Adineta steineri]
MGQFTKAQEIYKVLLRQASNESDMAPIYYQLGWIKHNRGEYQEALSSHEKALTIPQQLLPVNHPDLGDSYNRIGNVHDSMRDYPKALSYYELAVQIGQQSLPTSHPRLQQWRKNLEDMKK